MFERFLWVYAALWSILFLATVGCHHEPPMEPRIGEYRCWDIRLDMEGFCTDKGHKRYFRSCEGEKSVKVMFYDEIKRDNLACTPSPSSWVD